MTNRKSRNALLVAAAIMVLALLAHAWIDGGREPLRDVMEPVAVPHDSLPSAASVTPAGAAR